MLPGNLPTLLFDPRQQALDLPVRRTEATCLDQVFQGCVKLSEWGQTEQKESMVGHLMHGKRRMEFFQIRQHLYLRLRLARARA